MNEDLDNLAFRFFKLFAQYESTLKERDYFHADQNGRITVDWNRFANDVVGQNCLADLGEKREAAEFILDAPPKKQAVNDQKKIVWVEVPNDEKSVQALFGHISRMRNNLFHGAKFNGTWFDPDRSKALLERGLVILEHYEPWIEQ